MNVIFLDIDGPLLPRKMEMFHENRTSAIPKFEEFAIRAFNIWTRYSNAKTVFSTHWSYSFPVDELKLYMIHNGLGLNYHEDILTPKTPSSNRANEIVWWLEQHPEVENFIAVDDDTTCRQIEEMTDVNGKWIEVDYENGLSWKNFIDGCNALNIDYEEMISLEFKPELLDKK